SWSSCATTMSGRCLPHASTSVAASLVEGSSNESSARTAKVPSSAWAESAARKAALRSLRLTLPPKRVRTANAAPPPVQWGARVVPARARPVPFWRHGFERPPATRPRLLTARVPARSALSSARTVSWTRWGFTSAPKTCASSVRSFDLFPSPSRTGALGAATAHLLAHFQQVPVRSDPVLAEVAELRLREPFLRDLLVGDLHRVVAVDAGLLDRDHRTRPGLDHGHGRHPARLLVEDLGHSELSSDNA